MSSITPRIAYTIIEIEDVRQGDMYLLGRVWADPLKAVAEMRNSTAHGGVTAGLNDVGHGRVAAAVLSRGEVLRFGRFTVGPVMLR